MSVSFRKHIVRFKRFVRGCLFGLSGFAIASAASAQGSLERDNLIIGIGPDWGTSGHAVVAFHKGYFREEGLTKVSLKSFSAGLLQVEALAAGAVDVANTAQGPVLTLSANGIPVVVLASLSEYSDSLAVAIRKSANVTKPEQLKGLKIGVLKGTGSEQLVMNLAKEYKLDRSAIQLVNLAPPEQIASLSTGAIDGVSVWQPWVYLAGQKMPIDVVHTGAHSRFADNAGQERRIDFTRSVLLVSQRFVKSNPKTTDALLRAYAKAQNFIADPANYAEVVKLFSSQHNQSKELNQVILKDYTSTLALDDRYMIDMEAVQDFLAATGRLRKKVSVLDLTYGKPLARIAPELVTIDARWQP